MPTRDEHLAKAEHNEALALSIIGSNATGYYDWVVIALFYSALHYANAFVMQYLPQPTNHTQRRDFINRLNASWDSEFRNLKDESEAARYDVYNINQTRLDNEIRPSYETIKNAVRSALNL